MSRRTDPHGFLACRATTWRRRCCCAAERIGRSTFRCRSESCGISAGSVQLPEGFASAGIQLELLEQTGARTHVYGELARPGSFHIEGLEPGSYTVRAETKTKSPRDRGYAVAALEINERDIDDLKMEVRAGVTLHTVIRMAEEGVKVPSRVFVAPLSADGWMMDPDARLSEGLLAGLPPGEYLPVLNGVGMRGYALASVVYGGRTVQTGLIDVEASESTITLILTSKPGKVSGSLREPGAGFDDRVVACVNRRGARKWRSNEPRRTGEGGGDPRV